MRLTTVLLIATLMQVSAAGFAQRLTMQKTQASLKEVFTEIKKQTGYNVVWDSELLKNSKPVEAKFDNEDVCKVLDQILVKQNLDYTITDKTIVIKENKRPSFLENFFDRFNNIDVSGKILDENGKPLPGASVKVKKTGKGVSTDKDGRFFLRGVEEGAVLVVSFIGYLPKEVSASANMGNVVLEQSLSKLDEIQVIAYGTTTQRLSTGNVTTIKADVIEKQPVNNPLLALQGRVPGLFIEQATGFAGTGVKVRIQGQNSLSNGNDPLYVIDGVPFSAQLLQGESYILGNSGTNDGKTFGNPLNFINPSDIESIDVLKDADATSIYGSRAANGAILITTKKGKSGDTRVNLNLQSGWAKVGRKLDLMNSEQYLEMRREALKNDGVATPTPGNFGDNDLNGNWDNFRYTDWQKELIGGTAGYQDLNASVSGGNDQITFLIGAGYHRETTVFPGDYSDRKASVHFNIGNSSKNRRFKINLSGSYLADQNRLPDIDFTEKAMLLPPVAPPLYDAEGNINWAPDAMGNTTFGSNPIGRTFNKATSKTGNLMSNLSLSYQILHGLELKSNLGYNSLTSNKNNKSMLEMTQPEYLPYAQRSTIFGKSSVTSWSVEPQLSYLTNISKGRLEVLLGTTIQQNRSDASEIGALGFSNDLVMDDILSATTVSALSSANAVYKYNAVFGRVNYNWEDKYLLNLTGRRDGSSRFGPESQFHNFAALGAAWIFSNERLFKAAFPFISFGKIRGSYGTTGSDQIGDYEFLSLFNPLQNTLPYQGVPLYQPNKLTNPYLEWEETRKLQFGLDLGFIQDRILLNVNHYVNRSSNQLGGYTLPATTGFGSITRNQPWKIQNSGWELSLSSSNFQQTSFRWTSLFNLTIPKSLLVDYPDLLKSSNSRDVAIGKPLTSLFVYHYLGVDPATGVYLFADKNGNPTVSPDGSLDRTVLVDLAPKYYGGFQNSFTIKGFQLDILFSFVKQIAQHNLFDNSYPAGTFISGGTNQLASMLDRWQKPGDVAARQRFTKGLGLFNSYRNVIQSDAVWKDASYIRLKNVSLSWQLPKGLSQKIHFQHCSIFVQGQNLLTVTNYEGLDPESKSSRSLPPLRVVTLGIKLGL